MSTNLSDALFNLFEEIDFSSISSDITASNLYRLDANAYSKKREHSIQTLNDAKIGIKSLADFARVLQLTVFGKRSKRSSAAFGIPLYSGSEINKHNHETNFYISKLHTNSLPYGMIAEDGWILITLSGTVGTIGMSSDGFAGSIISDDVMRIIPNSKSDFGFLYVYLQSPLAQNLIKTMNYGSVIQHLKGFQMESFPVPDVPTQVRKRINSHIQKVIALRSEAKNLLKEAELKFNSINKLPEIKSIDATYYDPDKKLECLSLTSKEIRNSNNSRSEYRLDAHFYNPMAKLALKNINQCKSKVKAIEDVTERVFLVPRFKRNYVEVEYGVPFLSGKNIVQIRPVDLKYLSKTETKNLRLYYLEKNWTLITCSGTIGRTCFVWKNYEEYTATQHILRVVPDLNKVDPGYLCAFLSSSYGYLQVLRYRHGSVIDEITDRQIKKVLIPVPAENEQKHIGDLVRSAYDKRAEAVRLEDEAQVILMDALNK